MDPHIPLLCSCDACGTIFVAFSNEFVFCNREFVNTDYAKIYGYNRIVAGNWIYFKGSPKPGVVKSIFQSPDKQIIVVNYDGGPDQRIERPKIDIEYEESPEGYRLLPIQSAQTLLGDCIYHAIRDQFGIAVGLVNDGEKDKLVVLLKDKTLVFITLPPLSQNLPNDKLCSIVQNKLAQVFPEHCTRVSVEAGQGIVYLNGLVKNLSIQRAIVKCVNAIPKVRGCVDFTRVETSSFTTDAVIEKTVYEQIESSVTRLFDYKVNVSDGKVQIEASCYENERPKDLENRVAEIPGVRDLICLVSEIYEPINVELCKKVESEISASTFLRGANIRVSCNNRRFLLEGSVQSILQKELAFATVLKNVKTTSIENRLRIV
ncbi:MAG: BON domain-containing protein [Fibrobacter sp.]|nr:BON domain-containing protein [Fibrobacter sp.]MBR6833506.1 BON domain-containing protein [Fibrobacter sp.]